MMFNDSWFNSDELFVGDRIKKKIKNSKKMIKGCHCNKCIYAEPKSDKFEVPEGYIHCTYYPNTISKLDHGCKAGISREEQN